MVVKKQHKPDILGVLCLQGDPFLLVLPVHKICTQKCTQVCTQIWNNNDNTVKL